MKRLILIGLFTLALGVGSSHGQNVFGTWRGVFQTTEKFIGNGIPYGSPPYDPIDLELILHPFDPEAGRYGVSNYGAGSPGEFVYGGDFISFALEGNVLTMTSLAPVEGAPTGYADLVATINGDSMIGRYDARSPAGPGWIHLKGTIALTRVVPEPAAGLLLAVGGGWLAVWRRRGAGGRNRTDTPFGTGF